MHTILSTSPMSHGLSLSSLQFSGFLKLDGNILTSDLGTSLSEVAEFQSFWNNLETDHYMADGGTYRMRRFGVFHFNRFKELEYIGNQSFFQETSLNTLNGGIHRVFAELEKGFAQNLLLQKLIKHDIELLPLEVKSFPLSIFVHQIRIVAMNTISGNPTPEGIHQDGHLFVAQHLINRQNVEGGMSTIYDLDKNAIYSETLTNPFDSFLVNDPTVFHSVSPVESKNESGFRDMLLIDFNFLGEK